jgi:hypothetical protein
VDLNELVPCLDKRCKELSVMLTTVQQHRADAEQERQSVEWILQQRARDLHGLVETHLKKALEAAKTVSCIALYCFRQWFVCVCVCVCKCLCYFFLR